MADVEVEVIAERLGELSKNEIVAIAPLLALAEELAEDAGRQYDATSATVLKQIARKLVERLEEARDQDRWLSVKRAAAVVRRPHGTVRYWCRNELVVAREVGARDWEIDRESLLRRAAA